MTRVRFLRGTSVCLVLVLGALAQANWSETFDNGTDRNLQCHDSGRAK